MLEDVDDAAVDSARWLLGIVVGSILHQRVLEDIRGVRSDPRCCTSSDATSCASSGLSSASDSAVTALKHRVAELPAQRRAGLRQGASRCQPIEPRDQRSLQGRRHGQTGKGPART
jgi:hypothetical protein